MPSKKRILVNSSSPHASRVPVHKDVGEDVMAFCEKHKLKGPNLLRDTRCYLIGGMQYIDGRGWRDKVKDSLKNTGVKFYDPYHKPFVNEVPEDEASRADMLHWMETEQYDLTCQRMMKVQKDDIRLCNTCEWFIAVIQPKIASWGSAREIYTVVDQEKPIFLVIDDPDGKKATPLWLMSEIPHKHIYNSVDEVIRTVKAIDSGIIKLSSDRWRLLRPEYR